MNYHKNTKQKNINTRVTVKRSRLSRYIQHVVPQFLFQLPKNWGSPKYDISAVAQCRLEGMLLHSLFTNYVIVCMVSEVKPTTFYAFIQVITHS